MPYKLKKKDGQTCVMKMNPDGGMVEKKCYGSRKEAMDYMKALYANVKDASMHFSAMDTASMSDRMQKITDAFYSYGSGDMPSPRDCYIKDVFDDYLLVTNGKDVYKVGFTVDGEGDVKVDPPEDWKLQKYTDASMDMLLYTDLEGIPGVFDGLAASHDVAFVSMTGEELFIESADLEAYAANGQSVIESTRTQSGEIVGLPIDEENHNHKGGAGWIKGFELDAGRNIIRFLVEWTEKGAELIRSNSKRFFSPTVDPINKVILGGSLTNWPATRNSMGQLLLQPIELSQTLKGINMPKTIEELSAEMEKLTVSMTTFMNKLAPPAPAAPGTPTPPPNGEGEVESLELQNLLADDSQIDQLGELAQVRAKEIVRVAQRKAHVVEFVSKVVGGTPDHPVGLPIPARELTKVLLSLPETQSLAVERLLARVWDKALDFQEHGIREGDQFNLRRPVPKEFAQPLADWVATGKDAKAFFVVNPEAGNADDYNLSAYMKKVEA